MSNEVQTPASCQTAVMRSFSLEEMKQAFKAGQETIWEDLEQTTRCAKFESFEEWFEYSDLKSGKKQIKIIKKQ